jgi:transcriptional regulator with XRE-family HTH domain
MPDRPASAQRIRQLRTEAGLTQKQLAERAGVHVRSVQNWEKGLGLYGHNLESAAAALGVQLADITGTPATSRGDELVNLTMRVERIEAILTNMRVALNAGQADTGALQELVEDSLRQLLQTRTAPAAPERTPRAQPARR